MIKASLTDLDSLLVQVRSNFSRQYIDEAVNAYRAGANRTAIISTWIALSYDIIHKIRELADNGDLQAIKFVTDLQSAIDNSNIPKLQAIEESLLNTAYSEFEFIDNQQYNELKRLKEDRNLCAHPAFTKRNILYQPSAELVRSHIVHALSSLLIQQPVQGKTALAEFEVDLVQASFPRDFSEIKDYILPKYLQQSKETFIVNLNKVLLKLIISDDPKYRAHRLKIYNCIKVIAEVYPGIYVQGATEVIRRAIRLAEDDKVSRVVRLMGSNMNIWSALDGHEKQKCINVIKLNAKNETSLYQSKLYLDLFELPELKEERSSINNQIEKELDQRIEDLAKSSTYYSAGINGRKVLELIACVNHSQFTKLKDGLINNNYDQIKDAGESPEIWTEFFRILSKKNELFKEEWSEIANYVKADGDYSTGWRELVVMIEHITMRPF